MSKFDGTVKDTDQFETFKRVIMDCTEPVPLLTRYHLVNTRWFGIYLHKFHKSDDDRAFHDHPWSFVSFLFGGGYWENTPVGRFWRRRFSILWRPAEWQHWVEIKKPIWTLVVRWKERRKWGFILGGKWIHFREYGREFCT